MILNNTIVFTLLVILINSTIISAQDDFDLFNIRRQQKELSNISGPNTSLCEIRFSENKAQVSIEIDEGSLRQGKFFSVDYLWNDTVLKLYHPLISKPDYFDFFITKQTDKVKELKFEEYIFTNRGSGLESPSYSTVSFDGIVFHELEDTSLSYENIKFDSIYVNGYWVPISSDTLEGSYYITIQTESTYEVFIDTACSIFFDSLVYTFDGTCWQIKNIETAPCIGKYMNKLHEKNWERYIDNYSVYHNVETNLPDSLVTEILVENADQNELDFSTYTSLRDLNINTVRNKLTIKLPSDNVSLYIRTTDSLNTFRLSGNNYNLNVLKINTPHVALSSVSIHTLFLTLYTPEHLKLLNKTPEVNMLKLDFLFNPDLSKLDIKQNLKSLLISADTIHLGCASKLPKSLDSLVLYGHSNSFDFLDCPNNLKYLGVFYSNENEVPNLDEKYPEIKKGIWCFPEYAIVATPNGEKNINDVIVGDTVICINESGNLSNTTVTQVEFHYNCNTDLIQLNERYDYAAINNSPIEPFFSTQFIPNHPLFVSGLVKKTFEELNNEDALITLSNKNVPISYIESKHINYTGTLINISTKQGNYFINGVCFSNK